MPVWRSTMESVIRDYYARCKPRSQKHEDWLRSMPSLSEAIRVAAQAVDARGKRQSHQNRLSKSTLDEATRVLLSNQSSIERSQDFDDVHAWVDKLIGEIGGAGDLYVYDIASQIAVKMNLPPKHIYLHAGVRAGASCFGVPKTATRIHPSDLPPPLSGLPAEDLEDILCIYKSHFRHNREPSEREQLVCRPFIDQESGTEA